MLTKIASIGNHIPFVFSMLAHLFFKRSSLPERNDDLA
jgi:hypothetical protein